MNIFAVEADPVLAARALCDKHVVKMPLESAQLLCTTAHALGLDAPYKPTHRNHPCSLWLLEGAGNVLWLHAHGLELCFEYSRRYGKRHKSYDAIMALDIESMMNKVPSGTTPLKLAMPDEYKQDDPIEAYRAYYRGAKRSIATWKSPGAAPAWWH